MSDPGRSAARRRPRNSLLNPPRPGDRWAQPEDRRVQPEDLREPLKDRSLRPGDQPEHTGDQREHTGDQREHTGDQREHTGDQREHTGDRWGRPGGAGRVPAPNTALTVKAALNGSVRWLVLAAGMFILAELTLTPLRMPLGWDEITYIAQTSVHASPILMPPAHSRGAGLLAAPVTLLTTSVLVLRVWMALLSGAGLFLALLCWRGLRPTWVLAVAGFILGSLAVALLSGPLAMPDLWEALGALAVTGLFLQAVTRRLPSRVMLPLISIVVFFLFLVRYQDACFIVAPLIVATMVVPAWRNLRVLGAFAAGIIAGVSEWIGEAYAFYGGPASRLQRTAQQPPRFGLYFSLRDQLRVIDGPGYCPPGSCQGWRYPGLTIWWLALLVLVIIGVVAGRHLMRVSAGIAIGPALSVLAAYSFFVPIAAPRYLLPVFAMLTIPAADGIAWLVTEFRWRRVAIAAACAFLLTGAISQHFVERSELTGAELSSRLYVIEAGELHHLGIRAPCAVDGSATPVAYYLGCSVSSGGGNSQLVLMPPVKPVQPTGWRRVPLAGTPAIAYVRCPRAAALPLCHVAVRRHVHQARRQPARPGLA